MTTAPADAGAPSKAERRRLRDAHIHDHFGTLFALLLATFITSGFTEFRWARAATSVLELAMLAVAYFSTHTAGAKPITALLGVAGFVGIGITLRVDDDAMVAHGIVSLIIATIYIAILIAVFRRVLAQRHVSMETILGALCVYFIVGLLFSNIYAAVDAFSVTPIFGHPVPRTDYSYFSFVTLTTVGYGDIVAVTDIARRFAVIEAMTGQVFLATAVARLVSLYGVDIRSEERAARRRGRAEGERDDDATAAADADAATDDLANGDVDEGLPDEGLAPEPDTAPISDSSTDAPDDD